MHAPPPQNPLLAAMLICTAAALVAATMLLAKYLSSDQLGAPLHPLQISHGRFLFVLLILVSFASLRRPEWGPVHWGLHVGRTGAGWLGVTLLFASVAYIPMADATAISFLNPIFAMILAIPLLGERVGPVRWTAAGIAFVGTMILLRPTPESFQPTALIALAAALAMGLELIFIKKLTGREGVFQILLLNNLLGTALASLAVLSVWQSPSMEQWLALAALGGIMACAQLCFLNGMARADASFVAPFGYVSLIFAGLYDYAGFGTVPDMISLLGAVVILTGALILALREGRGATRR